MGVRMTVLITGAERPLRRAATPGPHPVLRHSRAVAHRTPTPGHAHPDREEPTVPHVLVHQQITEFERWKEVFDRLGPARAAASCRATTVFRNREVVVLPDFDDLASAREHIGSTELRRAWQQAGVTDPGTRSVLDLVESDHA
jgi:hypothetical protein